MDTTVTGIASAVVAELRSVGYMESTIGQYEKTSSTHELRRGTRRHLHALTGRAVASMTVSPRSGFSAQRRFGYAGCQGVRLLLATGRWIWRLVIVWWRRASRIG